MCFLPDSSFLDCKIKYQRVRPCKPNTAIRRKCQCHLLKITFRQVMIDGFINPLSFALSRFSPILFCPHGRLINRYYKDFSIFLLAFSIDFNIFVNIRDLK